MKIARIYKRVSTSEQDLTRQAALESMVRDNGFYIAGIYKEKASGARADRPELLRMIADLQSGDVVIAEKIDRISRLPLPITNAFQPHFFNKPILKSLISSFYTTFCLWAIRTNKFNAKVIKYAAKLCRTLYAAVRVINSKYTMFITVKCQRFTMFFKVLASSKHVIESRFSFAKSKVH